MRGGGNPDNFEAVPPLLYVCERLQNGIETFEGQARRPNKEDPDRALPTFAGGADRRYRGGRFPNCKTVAYTWVDQDAAPPSLPESLVRRSGYRHYGNRQSYHQFEGRLQTPTIRIIEKVFVPLFVVDDFRRGTLHKFP